MLLAAPSTDALITIKPPVSAGPAAAKRCSDGDGAARPFVAGSLPGNVARGFAGCSILHLVRADAAFPFAVLRRNGFSS